MAATFTIPTIWTAVDKYSPAVKNMEKANRSFTSTLESTAAKSDRWFKRLTPGLSDATKQMLDFASSAALIGGVFATGRFSANAIMDYETAIQSLQAVTGTTAENMPALTKQVNELATSSRKSSIDVAKSFETIGSAMSQYLDNPEALRIIAEAGITLSKASRMELQPTLEALTSVMNQFGLEADKANDTINRLTAGEIVGSVSTAKISEHLQQFGAVASANNVTLSESVALVETLGKKLPNEQLGTASRNIITFMSAAKGMPKEARAQLQKHGVSLDILMDKHKSFGERLKELSKIQGDAVAMEKFFGRENIAAGTTIFQNLGLYDQWSAKIKTTNEAQNQAKINSNTLANKLDELKNRWVNMLTSSDGASEGLNRLKNIIGYVTDHLDDIVDIGIKVIKFYGLWKAANIAMNGLMFLNNIRLGINNALRLESIALLEGNTVATTASTIAEKGMAAAMALSTGNLEAFNIALGLSPIGAFLLSVGALAAAFYGVNKAIEVFDEPLNAAFQRQEQLRQEGFEVLDLRDKYLSLGKTLKEAEQMALAKKQKESFMQLQEAKIQLASVDPEERQKAAARINEIGQQMANLSQVFAGKDMGQRFANSRDTKSMVGSIGEVQPVQQYDWLKNDFINPKQAEAQAIVNNMNTDKTIEANITINAPAGTTATTDNRSVIPIVKSTKLSLSAAQ